MPFDEKSKAKMHAKLLERFGSEEAILAWRKEVGSRGGKAGKKIGFAHGKVNPSEAGKIGGAKSRRKKHEK